MSDAVIDEARLGEASLLITEINLGATAIGTGINTHPDYAHVACRHLARISGVPNLRSRRPMNASTSVRMRSNISVSPTPSSSAIFWILKSMPNMR